MYVPFPHLPRKTDLFPVKANPDYTNPKLNTPLGIYAPNCGLDNVMISWGHDEYLYLVMKDQSSLPKEALSMIRYHSFYPWHRGGAYTQFMAEGDEEQLKAVRAFNRMSLRMFVSKRFADMLWWNSLRPILQVR